MTDRDILDVDVLFVGAGVATLSSAIHLMGLIDKHQTGGDGGDGFPHDVVIAVLEKGPYVGAHNISGAVMEPAYLKTLAPEVLENGLSCACPVTRDQLVFLKGNRAVKLPFIPAPLKNHGNYVVSLAELTAHLGTLAEDKGVEIFTGFAATEILYNGEQVVGVGTGNKGRKTTVEPDSYEEPGIDIRAKVTVFGEGARGSLTKEVIEKFNLDEGKNPQSYVVGVKEVWEVPGSMQSGEIIHTMGFPHPNDTYGGGFLYGMKDNLVSLGLMTGLDYENPFLDPHLKFQEFKTHPFIDKILEGGTLIQYGAKTVPVGGYFSIPKLTFNGGMLVGDTAGLFVSRKIKGIHAAIKSGMLAAEAIFQALSTADYSELGLSKYENDLYASVIGKELYESRNFHQAFQKGRWAGIITSGLQTLFGGRIFKERLDARSDYLHRRKVEMANATGPSVADQAEKFEFDRKRTFDKDHDVFHAGVHHEEHQTPHLKIHDLNLCNDVCWQQYRSPCQRFCPANVYEMETDTVSGEHRLKLNFSNCLHCKTCDIKDPFNNIIWTPPEGGGGPKYTIV